jgi:methionine aminopeptidase
MGSANAFILLLGSYIIVSQLPQHSRACNDAHIINRCVGNNLPGLMQPGHCFTIEPCLVQGDQSRGYGWIDGWTYATESNARSAQFEHQLLVTENGVDVLTRI